MVLPAPDGPTSATRLARRHAEAQPIERARLGPQRISEGHIAKGDLATRRLRQRFSARAATRSATQLANNYAQTLGGAHALRLSCPRFRSSRRRPSRRVPHRARTGESLPPVISPDSTSCAPYHSTPTTLANTRKMAMAVSSGRGALARAFAAPAPEGSVDRRAEALRRFVLMREGLHHSDLRQTFAGVGGSVPQRVLGLARKRPDRAAISHERQHDHRDGDEPGERQFWSSPPS